MSGTGQLGFAEAFMSPGLGTNRKLERLDGLIDWSALEPSALRVREGRRGRPPYAPLSMLKALYLQALYDLSDPVWRRRCWTGSRFVASAALRWTGARRTRPRSAASAQMRALSWRRRSRRSTASWMPPV